jgi:hypothetical protein
MTGAHVEMVETPTIHPAIKAAVSGYSRAAASDATHGWDVRGLPQTTDPDEAVPIRPLAAEGIDAAYTAAARRFTVRAGVSS